MPDLERTVPPRLRTVVTASFLFFGASGHVRAALPHEVVAGAGIGDGALGEFVRRRL